MESRPGHKGGALGRRTNNSQSKGLTVDLLERQLDKQLETAWGQSETVLISHADLGTLRYLRNSDTRHCQHARNKKNTSHRSSFAFIVSYQRTRTNDCCNVSKRRQRPDVDIKMKHLKTHVRARRPEDHIIFKYFTRYFCLYFSV